MTLHRTSDRPASGLHVLVVTGHWPTADRPQVGIFLRRQVDSLRAAGVEVDVFATELRSDPRRYLRSRRQLARRLRDGSYDVIHVHFGQTYLIVPRTSVPVVLTCHGTDLRGIVGRNGRHTMRGRVLQAIARAAARRADEVIVVSRSLAASLPEGVAYTVLPLGVDLDVFKPQPKAEARAALGLRADRRLVLFGGDPDIPVKRFALAQAAVERANTDIDLITIRGLEPDQVVDHMNACDALLVTSLHEGGPLVVKEALACNLPVVSCDVGDVADWIADLPGCALVASDDPDAIASSLDRVLSSGAGFDGRTAIAPASWDALARRQIEIYDRVVHASSLERRPA